MWFGNLVTFEWWGYFWLNEAFARYYQFYLSHEVIARININIFATVLKPQYNFRYIQNMNWINNSLSTKYI